MTFAPRPSRRALRIHLGIPEDADLVFSVRRLVPRMGLPLLIDACIAARQKHPNVFCLIGGSGPDEAKLKNLVRQKKAENIVRLIGNIPVGRLSDYYGAADLYVLPTIAYEGLGLTTLEALASGLPVVGTPVGATPEILGPINRAYVAEAADADALARAMTAYLDLPEAERVNRRAEVRRYAEEHWRWEHSVEALESVLAELPPSSSSSARSAWLPLPRV